MVMTMLKPELHLHLLAVEYSQFILFSIKSNYLEHISNICKKMGRGKLEYLDRILLVTLLAGIGQ